MVVDIVKVLINTPFYPHWLEVNKNNKGDKVILSNIRGKILEVGAGDGNRKNLIMHEYKKIEEYLATDYLGWNSEFKKIDNRIARFGEIASILSGFKKRATLDAICSATNLPFKNEEFDYHISFNVLEHISEPDIYFKEASRVLKKGGYVALSVPFFYRIHGGEPLHKLDFYRYSYGFFYSIAEKYNLKIIKIFSNTGYGTSFASMSNQWIIRRIFESSIIVKIILLVVSPFIFFYNNVIGYIIDTKPDKRFSTRVHVLMKKK